MLAHVVCPCLLAMLETRDHILYECNRFNGVIRFLEENHDTFCFRQFSSGSGNVIPPAGKAGVHPVTYLT